MSFRLTMMPLVLVAVLGGCGHEARYPVSAGSAGTGPDPVLPPPPGSRLPTVDIAPAVGWPPGVTPVAAEGTEVNAFAEDLDHPRSLYGTGPR